MNPCEQFEIKLPAYVAGEMSAADAAQFRTHLDGCASCREQAEAMRLLHGAMAMSPLPEKLDAHRVAAIAEKFRAVNQQTAKPKASSIFARLPNPFAALRRPQNEDGFHWTIIFSRIIPFVALPALMLAAFIYMEATLRNRFAHVLAFRDPKSSSLGEANDELAATPQASTRPTSGKDDKFASGRWGWAEGKRLKNEAAGEPAPPLLKEEDIVVAYETENSIKPTLRSHGGRVALVAQSEVVQSELKPAGQDAPMLTGDSDYVIANAEPSENAAVHASYRAGSGSAVPARPSLKPNALAATPPPAPPAMPVPVTRSISGVVSDPQAVANSKPVNAPAANANYFAYSDKSDTAGNWDNLQKNGTAPAQKSGGFAGSGVHPVPLVGDIAGGGLSPDPNGPAITLATTSELNGRGEVRRGTVAAPGAKAPADASALAYNFQTPQGETLAVNGTLDGSKLSDLTKTGSGTLSIGGLNTYSGGTVVNAGLLVINGATVASDQPLVMKGLYEGRSSGGAHLGAVPGSPPVRASGGDGLKTELRRADGRDGSEREVVELASAAKEADAKLGRDVAGVDLFFDQSEAKKEVAKAKPEVLEKRIEEQAAWFGAVAGGGGVGNVGGGAGIGFGGDVANGRRAGVKSRELARNGEELAKLSDLETRDHGLVAQKQLAMGDTDGNVRLEGLPELQKKMEQQALFKSSQDGEKLAEAGDQVRSRLLAIDDRLSDPAAGQAPAGQNKILSKNAAGYVGVDIPADVRAKRKTVSDEVGGANGKESGEKAAQLASSEKQIAGIKWISTVPNNFSVGTATNWATAIPEPVRPAPPRVAAGFNPYIESATDTFSTFSIDVDTASFTLTRRAIEEGRLPDAEQVRTEEIVNSFDYDYAAPANGAFAMHAELAPSPFRAPLELLKVGIQGSVPGRNAKKAAVLTLVIDTSGSMDTADRLGRIRTSLKMLAGKLQPQDSIAIVAFNTEARMLLDRTAGADKARILAAIDSLTPSGSTQLEGGMRVGYEVAARGFVSGAANRVILMSDGVANLGAATAQEILASVSQFRAQGIYLTVLGFGSGTYDDAMLMQLADKGDGMYAFVDSDEEARRLLVDQWEQTLHVIAKDVKIQIEFNPERVARWRQIGYEKRQLTKQDFRNDSVDAGEVGSGQAVTALYDIELKELTGIISGYLRIPPIATMRVRYKDPDTGKVTELEQRIGDGNRRADFASAPARFRIAACAAEFAELLRVSPYSAGSDFAAVIEALRPAASQLPLDQRVQELLRMAERARGLAK